MVVTTRKQHLCAYCNLLIDKGRQAVTRREVAVYWNEDDFSDKKPYMVAYTHYYHPKCAYREKRHKERFAAFVPTCQHPERFQDTEYDYSLPGSINGDRCGLCDTLH